MQDDDDDEEDEEQEVKDQPSIYRAPSMPPLVREPSLLMSRQTSTTLGLSPPGGRGEQEEPQAVNIGCLGEYTQHLLEHFCRQVLQR